MSKLKFKMADPKYASLPGIDTESPDVYETDDLPEAEQTSTEEELESESISQVPIDTDAAYKHFRHSNISAANVDFSDSISPDRPRHGYDLERTEFELSADKQEPETIQQKYQRLQFEVRSLVEDVSHIQESNKEGAGSETLNPVQISRQLEYLQRQMTDLHLDELLGPGADVTVADPQGALQQRLLTQIDSFKASSAKTPEKGGKPIKGDDSVKYELHYKPEQAQFNKNAKISYLEERLERLEATVGQRGDKLNALTADTDNKSLLGAVGVLDSKLSLLDPAQQDQIEARLQSISHKLGQVGEKFTDNPQQQTKISELYDIVKKWEGVADSLPQLVDRLVALKDLHEQALQFGQTLSYLDAEQQHLTSSLTAHSDMMHQLQDIFTKNNAIVKTNVDSLQKRIEELQKKK